ncbi:MAG: hypothetical protein P8J50_19335 [Acidimicrobiales bacterium]|nr:hypothetical protein [Acidimicrobiales bacterium]
MNDERRVRSFRLERSVELDGWERAAAKAAADYDAGPPPSWWRRLRRGRCGECGRIDPFEAIPDPAAGSGIELYRCRYCLAERPRERLKGGGD